MKKLNNIIALALMTLSTSCAQMQIDQQRNALINRGQPLAYVDGYGDGFSTGTAAAGNPYFGYRKNCQRFENDTLYHQGWEDGYRHGERKYSNAVLITAQ